MKILWIVNVIMPELARELKLPLNNYGGWLIGLAYELKNRFQIELHIATFHPKINCKKSINGIYYSLVDNSVNSWKKLYEEIDPDVVHIHGTEYDYGMNYIIANGSSNTVFSIQGLVSVYQKYYTAGLSNRDVYKNITLRDILKRDNLFQARNKFRKRGELERLYFKKCEHVIGRTDWDKTHALAINPNINYHYGAEILRDGFYASPKWNYNDCIPHTIFLSQAGYPIKGLHQLLKALPFLIEKYPNIKVKIAGHNIFKRDGFLDKLTENGYSKYINKLITNLKLQNRIIFLGNLSEDEMINEYLKANVFVCPSAIENSPNSLAEAQLLGLPIISAYVGGVQSMVVHGETGWLYRFEEIEMLAYYIDKVFKEDVSNDNFSTKEIAIASSRHDRIKCTKGMLDLYIKLSHKLVPE